MADPRAVRAAWHDLGRLLAEKRRAANLSQQALGVQTNYSRSSIGRIETGLQHVNRTFWEAADAHLGAGGALLRGYDAAEALQRAHQRPTARAQGRFDSDAHRALGQVPCRNEACAFLLQETSVAPEVSPPSTVGHDPVDSSAEIKDDAERPGISRRAILQAAEGTIAAIALRQVSPRAGFPDAAREAVLTATIPRDAGHAINIPLVQQEVSRLHLVYQQARYDEAVAAVPALMHAISSLANDVEPNDRQRAAVTIAFANLVVAKLALKYGDPQLAWLTADRAHIWASQARIPALNQVTRVAIGSALLALPDRLYDAATVVEAALSAANRRSRDPAEISTTGALHLVAAGVAARLGDHSLARQHFDDAAGVADSLGEDRNELWTAFGPTNVLIHQIGFAAEQQPEQAIDLGERVDTTRLHPALASRRSQVHLDLAAAFAHRPGGDASAVLHLLQAEDLAPQLLMIHPPARSLILKLVGRQRTASTPGLRALATRVRLVAS